MFGNVFPTGKMLVKSGKITAADYPCKGVRLLNSNAQVSRPPLNQITGPCWPIGGRSRHRQKPLATRSPEAPISYLLSRDSPDPLSPI